MIAGFSYYEICLYFMEYSFFGWILEVLYHAVTKGKIINRGFLNGPVCPIYGFGAIGVFMFANTIDAAGSQLNDVAGSLNNIYLFLGGILIATVVELIGGWLLDVLFHTRWWNYSAIPFNFKGYICPQFSILWGIAIMFSVRILQPLMASSTKAFVPENIGWPVLAVLYTLMAIDLVVTCMSVVGLNHKLAELDKIREAMRTPSNLMTEAIAQPAIRTSQHVDEGKVQTALAKAELADKVADIKDNLDEKISLQEEQRKTYMDQLQQRRQEILLEISRKKGSHVIRRILKAFPQFEPHRYDLSLQEIKEELRRKWK